MGKRVFHLSDIATQQTNTADVTTPILRVDADDGILLRFLTDEPVAVAVKEDNIAQCFNPTRVRLKRGGRRSTRHG
jgi:hypothetical protein